MAKAFDPIAEGATLVDKGFNPESEGATLAQPLDQKQQLSSDYQKAIQGLSQVAHVPGVQTGLGFAQGISNIVPGIENLGIKAYNAFSKDQIPERKGYHFAPETGEARVGEFGSYFAPGGLGKAVEAPAHIKNIPMIAEMIKKASNVFSKAPSAAKTSANVLSELTKGAAQGAVFNPEDQGINAILGAGGAGLGMGLSAGAKQFGIGVQPGSETLQNLKPEDVQQSVEAARRLGTPLTPAEASRNPFIAGQQGRYARTSEAAYENVKAGLERKESEKSAVSNLLNTIYDKSTASKNKIINLYNEAYKQDLDTDLVNQLKSDPIYAQAFDMVSKDPAWQRKMQGVSENNFAYLDKVRKSIADQENKLIRSGEKSKAAEYTEARNNLVDLMDNAAPVYKKARDAAQKSIIRSQIEKKLKTGEVTGSAFFNKLIKNQNNFEKLHADLRNVPEAQQQLRDMRDAWHSLVNVEKPSTASYQSEKSLNQARSSLERALQLWNSLTGKTKNLESVKFVRNMDKWSGDLHNAQLTGKKNHVESVLSDIMSKAFPATYTIGKEANQ